MCTCHRPIVPVHETRVKFVCLIKVKFKTGLTNKQHRSVLASFARSEVAILYKYNYCGTALGICHSHPTSQKCRSHNIYF